MAKMKLQISDYKFQIKSFYNPVNPACPRAFVLCNKTVEGQKKRENNVYKFY
jgi:hypothetical protein